MPGGAGGDGEVGEKSRVVPVREARHEHALEVGHDGAEGFRILRRVRAVVAVMSPGFTLARTGKRSGCSRYPAIQSTQVVSAAPEFPPGPRQAYFRRSLSRARESAP